MLEANEDSIDECIDLGCSIECPAVHAGLAHERIERKTKGVYDELTANLPPHPYSRNHVRDH